MSQQDTKIAELPGIRDQEDEDPVELWRYGKTGRLVVVARNEGGYNCTRVDLLDLLDAVHNPEIKSLIEEDRRTGK